jgi:hypothetical protein
MKISDTNKRKLSALEVELIHRAYGINVDIRHVGRNSEREGDVEITGTSERGIFTAWLPLAVIHAVDWVNPAIYGQSDGYGELGHVPPQGYDWSAIRDSSKEQVWKMFEVAVKAINFLR